MLTAVSTECIYTTDNIGALLGKFGTMALRPAGADPEGRPSWPWLPHKHLKLVNGSTVRAHTNGWRDGLTDATKCIISLASRSVINVTLEEGVAKVAFISYSEWDN